MKVAVLKGGRSLERGVSLRSGSPGRGRAGAARPRGAADRRRRRPGQAARAPSGPTSPSSPCTASAARTAPRRSCWRSSASPSPAPAPPPAPAAWTRSQAKHAIARGRSADAGLVRLQPDRLPRARRRRRARPRWRRRLGFPLVVKPSRGGSSLGVKFAAAAAEVPQALVSAFSYDDRVLLERFVDGRELAVSVLGGEALPVVEAIPAEGDRYDFEARYEIGRTRFVCPAELAAGRASAP